MPCHCLVAEIETRYGVYGQGEVRLALPIPMTSTFSPSHPGWGPLWRDFVGNPENYRKLRNGCLWMLLYVIAGANHRTGKFQTTWSQIAKDTGLSEQHCRSMAGHLVKKGYVSLARQGGDQVLLVVQRWKPMILGLRSQPRSTSAAENGVLREQPGTPPLAKEVATALGAQDEIEAIVDLVNIYPEIVIRAKLDAALAVPAAKIRVSRFALWRYLLEHANSHDNTT